jgi:hypothetical protein
MHQGQIGAGLGYARSPGKRERVWAHLQIGAPNYRWITPESIDFIE